MLTEALTTCANWLFPQHQPRAWSSIPHECVSPARRTRKGLSPHTMTGEELSINVPVPRLPVWFPPQQNPIPPLATPQECVPPAETTAKLNAPRSGLGGIPP